MTESVVSSKSLLKLARSFHTKKRLGQHFLVSAETLTTIASSLDLQADDSILEIGPGIGFLTRFLAASGANIVAVELDRETINELKSLKLPNLEIKHGDFLAYDIASGRFRDKGSQGWTEPDAKQKLKIAGNVPYQITGLILAHLLGEIGQPNPNLKRVERIVLMVQKEVAERMVAQPGSKQYAQLSLLIQYHCRAELIQEVPAQMFYPPPRVDSAIVRLFPHQAPVVECTNTKLLRRVIKSGFAQRRKMLRNALNSLGLGQENIDAVFRELRFDPQVRAENISLEQFAILTDAIAKLGSKSETMIGSKTEN